MSHEQEPVTPYGLLARFRSPEALVEASQTAHDAGFRRMEAYSPFPVHGLSEAIGYKGNRVAPVVFIGRGPPPPCSGGSSPRFLLQYYSAVLNYPINIAGHPMNSWPMFIPITFRMRSSAAPSRPSSRMLWFNGLPMPYHPVFNDLPSFPISASFLAAGSSCRSSRPTPCSTSPRPGASSRPLKPTWRSRQVPGPMTAPLARRRLHWPGRSPGRPSCRAAPTT